MYILIHILPLIYRFLFIYHERSDTCVSIEIVGKAEIPQLSRISSKIFLPLVHYSLG